MSDQAVAGSYREKAYDIRFSLPFHHGQRVNTGGVGQILDRSKEYNVESAETMRSPKGREAITLYVVLTL